MVRILAVASALALSAAVSGYVVPRATAPASWDAAIMEPYDTYHTRYMALNCQNKHNTDFFTSCCHPLKANETLATARAPECNPANVSASASASASATATATASASAPTESGSDDDCDDEDDGSSDDEEDCDDEPSSIIAPTSSAAPAPVTTSAAPVTTTAAPITTTEAPVTTTAAASKKAAAPPVEISASVKVSTSEAPKTTAKPTTSEAAPTTTATPTTTHKTSAAAATSSASSSSSGGSLITGGEATFFDQEGAAGSCGNVNPDSALIVAVQAQRMNSSLCGKKVLITNTANGKQVTATVQDTCPGCQGNANSLDLSHGAFDAIAEESQGVVPIQWTFLD